MTERLGRGATIGDRALVLHEKGLSHSVIAERLGIRVSSLSIILQRAKERKAKKEGEQ